MTFDFAALERRVAALESAQTASLRFGRVTVELTGFEEFSGTWCIKYATHKLGGNGGYSVSMELTSPAPTEGGKTESFTREAGENAKKSGSSASNSPALTYEELIAKVHADGNEIDKLILCLPLIAISMSNRTLDEDDARGWQYLSAMFYKWFAGKPNSDPYTNRNYFWVSIEWALNYRRVKNAYNELITPEYLFKDEAKYELEKILRAEEKFSPFGKVYFDYINSPAIFWKQDYFQRIGVGRPNLFVDGLFAALGAFSLCALAKGYTEPYEDGFRIVVTGISVFILDLFNFEGADNLGYWSCNPPMFAIDYFPGSLEIKNQYFNEFRKKFDCGNDFVVLSDLKAVDNFKVFPYEVD